MSESKPSVFGEWDYIHLVHEVCTSCSGQGYFSELLVCGGCMGKGEYTRGCGGAARIDPLHPALGADCSGCQCQVPTEELTRGG